MRDKLRVARSDSGKFDRGMKVSTRPLDSKRTINARVVGCTEDELLVKEHRGINMFFADPQKTIYLGDGSFRWSDMAPLLGSVAFGTSMMFTCALSVSVLFVGGLSRRLDFVTQVPDIIVLAAIPVLLVSSVLWFISAVVQS